MKTEGTLRRRIVAAHTWLALAVCGLFAVGAFFGIELVEAYVVQRRLELVVQWQAGRPAGTPAASLPPGLAYFAGTDLTPGMRRLRPGFHHEYDGTVTVHTLAYDDAAGQRHVAIDRVPDFELIERDVAIALALGTALSVALAALLGRLTAGRVIAPLTALAVAVEQGTLEASSPALARSDEIGRLGRSFAARADELRAVLDREQRFSGDASHELRTPLTVIAGAAELLALELADQPKLLPAVERIQRTAAEMRQRVSALLLLSRAPDALAAPLIELRPIVEREAERCQPLLAGKPVDIVVDAGTSVFVSAHPELVGVAIGNLLRNACAYTDAGRIAIRLRPDRLLVEDSGPGLPADVRDQLFSRLSPGPRDPEAGTGFGLALAKRIADHLGWSIGLEDGPAGGSIFSLRFAAPTEGKRPAAPVAVPAARP
jgi:signal transduction histidine kinase